MAYLKAYLLIQFLLVGTIASAQPPQGRSGGQGIPSIIKGKVVDSNEENIPYASVAIYSKRDSTLRTGGATDKNGQFNIKVRPGRYFIKISFLSYKEAIIDNVQVTRSGTDLGVIKLSSNALEIDEVEIRAEQSQMELKLDKRVFNVGKDLANTGGNAADILENVPSVTVDIEGNVSLRGSENVRILVDGKPSGLVGISSNDALRQLQGNLIDRVEVITNPSARYDAEGEVGIINIVLKKGREKGLNGTFEITAGYPDNYRVSFTLNNRTENSNVFASYGLNYRRTPGSGESFQEFFGDTVFYYERTREHTRGGFGQNIRLGSDFFLNSFNTLTVSGLYRNSNGSNDAVLVYKDFDANGQLFQTVVRNDDEEEDQENIEFSVSHVKTFDKKGKEWTSDLKWNVSNDTEHSDLFEDGAIDADPLTQRADNTEDEENVFIQSDFVTPIGDEGVFETGVRGTFRIIENKYKVEELAADDSWNVLSEFDNHFIYQENIYAAYMMMGNQMGSFSYQAGLRAEHSDISTELLVTGEENPREYTNLFPSLHLAQELDSTNTIQLSYSRRISRPRFRHLLPFFTFSDSRNFFSGNPDLNPEFTNSFELGHLKYFGKGSVLSSVYYRHREDVIQRITIADSTGFTRIFPINLGEQDAFGLEFNIGYIPHRWWRVNTNFNFYYANTAGAYENQDLSAEAYTWTNRTTSKWTIKKEWDAQLSINYRGPQQTTQGEQKSLYSIDLGFSRDILSKKGTVVISARDLLNTRKRRSITEGPDFYSESEFQWRARQFLVSFNYRLNQDKNRKRSRESGDYGNGEDMGF